MNKRIVFLVLIFGLITLGNAQEKYLCKNGHIWIYSHTPFEDIEAHNNEVASVITTTGDVAFQMLIKSFKFKRALMEEHFNENYMESGKYPKSDFKGKIINLDSISFSKSGIYIAVVDGNLTIHNTSRKIHQTGRMEIKENKIYLTTKFDVVPQNYGIEIPSAVRDKIAKTITINVEMVYDLYKK